MVLRGTNWKLVYSDSKGPSGGKVGPFNALVEQRFAAEEDRLVNSAQLGPLKVRVSSGFVCRCTEAMHQRPRGVCPHVTPEGPALLS